MELQEGTKAEAPTRDKGRVLILIRGANGGENVTICYLSCALKTQSILFWALTFTSFSIFSLCPLFHDIFVAVAVVYGCSD